MTGWIKMGTGLASHGKVKALRRALKADRLRVIGGLWAVWCVFDEHSAGGQLAGYTLDDMDEEIGWRGFSAAMQDIGWLIETDDGLEAPDYEEHNGPNAKRRALDASRKGSARKAGRESAESPPDVGKKIGQLSASDADTTRNREEKRREEYSEANASDAAASPPAPPPSPKDRVFAFGVPLLTAAGVTDRNARSMLAGLCKRHGDEPVADAIDRCAREQAVEPVSWLQAALNGAGKGRPAGSAGKRRDIFEGLEVGG